MDRDAVLRENMILHRAGQTKHPLKKIKEDIRPSHTISGDVKGAAAESTKYANILSIRNVNVQQWYWPCPLGELFA